MRTASARCSAKMRSSSALRCVSKRCASNFAAYSRAFCSAASRAACSRSAFSRATCSAAMRAASAF